MSTLARLSLFEAARDAPHRVALVVEGKVRTFGDLAPRVRATCAWLVARGVVSGCRVALVARNDEASIVLLYALMELSAVAVFLHPRMVAVERDAIVRRTSPILVVHDAAAEIGAAHDTGFECAPPHDDERALGILFTSGTSGESKGAVLSRAAFVEAARASAANFGWRDDDRWLLCMPLSHVGGLSIVTRCLLARRTAVVLDRFELTGVDAAIHDHRVTIASFVPTMLHRLFEDPAWRLPPAVRIMLLGGAATPPELLLESRRRDVPALTTYGLTEACAQVTTQRYGTPPDPAAGSGVPLDGARVRIVDGEIQVRSAACMTGYLGLDVQPFTSDGWLQTSDLGRLDEAGRLHVDGRRSDLIVTGGENVYPAEVEAVVAKLPGVEAACVFGVPDPAWGQVVAVAIVAAEPTAPPSAQALEAGFAESLASYKRPRLYTIVDELPMTGSGKLRRSEACRVFADRVKRLR